MASSTALPASMCSRFLRVAISIILGERSIAVIVPVVSLSQTKETATPWPQPTSSRRSAARTSRVSTAQTNRSDALPATAPEIASHAREVHADLLDDRSASSCCSFARIGAVTMLSAGFRAEEDGSAEPLGYCF